LAFISFRCGNAPSYMKLPNPHISSSTTVHI
jgi:hypothetical protein